MTSANGFCADAALAAAPAAAAATDATLAGVPLDDDAPRTAAAAPAAAAAAAIDALPDAGVAAACRGVSTVAQPVTASAAASTTIVTRRMTAIVTQRMAGQACIVGIPEAGLRKRGARQRTRSARSECGCARVMITSA